MSYTSNSEVANLTIVQTPAPRPKAKTARELRLSGRASQTPTPIPGTPERKTSATHEDSSQHNPFILEPRNNRSMHASPPRSMTPRLYSLSPLHDNRPQDTSERPPFTGRISKTPLTTPRRKPLPLSRPQSAAQLNDEDMATNDQDIENNSVEEGEISEGHYSGPEHMYDSQDDDDQ